LVSSIEVVIIVLIGLGIGGRSSDLHGEGSIGGISGSSKDTDDDGSNTEADSQADTKGHGNTGSLGLGRSDGDARSSITIANSALIDESIGVQDKNALIVGGGIAQECNTEGAVWANKGIVSAVIDGASDSGAVVVQAIRRADRLSEDPLTVKTVAANLAGSVSRITSVEGAVVSVVAVLGGIHQHMEATLVHRRGGCPGNVAKVVGARVCIGTIGHIGISAISTDLVIAIGVVVPCAQSSADVVLATVPVAS